MNITHSECRTHPDPHPDAAGRFTRRRGFTFTEIMFAVILLGIGFIMLAGMFPVAIQQTRSAVEDTTSAAVAQSAARYLQQVFSGDKLICSVPDPSDYRQSVWSLPHRAANGVDPALVSPKENDGLYELWDRVRGGMIWDQNPRYAWVPLYRRGGVAAAPDATAVVTILVLESRNKQFFEPSDVNQGVLAPKVVEVRRLDAGDPQAGTSDQITFNFNHGSDQDCLAEGAFVIIAENESNNNQTAGRIYRLGSPIGTVNQPAKYNLAAANGLSGDTFAARDTQKIDSTVNAYVIGKAITDPTKNPTAINGNNPYIGPAMDIGVYTTIIPLRQE